MLTLQDAMTVNGWDAGPPPNGHASIDSNLSERNHQNIVFNARTVIAAMNYDAAALQDAGRQALNRLKIAYATPATVVRIIKGIHQRETNPHLNLRIDGHATIYHLNVTATRNAAVEDDLFEWKGEQFTVQIGNTITRYPDLDLVQPISRHSRPRGYSFSADMIAAKIVEKAQRILADQVEAERVEAAKLRQSRVALMKNKMAAHFDIETSKLSLIKLFKFNTATFIRPMHGKKPQVTWTCTWDAATDTATCTSPPRPGKTFSLA